jgi:lipoprotein-anchoring transpeptidase ErfK/SrfK
VRAVRVLLLAVMMGFVGLTSGAAAGNGPAAAALQPAAEVVAAPQELAAPAQEVPAPEPVVPATPPPPPPPPAPVQVPGTPCLDTARACVDLSSNQAWLIKDGAIEYGPVPTTSGRRGFRTPPGTFHVTFKNRDHVSSIYDAAMPYSVFFNGGIAFHQGSLRQQSHGCIHLSRTAARTFFGALGRGDVVQVVR